MTLVWQTFIDAIELLLQFFPSVVGSCLIQNGWKLPDLHRRGRWNPVADAFVKLWEAKLQCSSLLSDIIGWKLEHDPTQPFEFYFMMNEKGRDDIFEVCGCVWGEDREIADTLWAISETLTAVTTIMLQGHSGNGKWKKHSAAIN